MAVAFAAISCNRCASGTAVAPNPFVRFVAGLAALTLLSCAWFSPRVVTSSLPEADAVVPVRASGTVDLYGNEVIDAVATYSIDPAGSLYELHSPQTELPRLASPKS
jgi:hypothetical protein